MRSREGQWIRQVGSLNQIVSGQTPRQYREDNKDKLREQKQQYREQNKDILREQKQQYRGQNKDRLREQQQQYRDKNSNTCTCVCGSLVNKLNMCKHIKTEKHKLFSKTMDTTSSEHEEYNGYVSTTASDIGSDTSHFDLSSLD